MVKEVSRVIVVDVENKLLLGKRVSGWEEGKWHILGGKIDQGETAADAARRELVEEAGLDISPTILCSGENNGWLSHYFIAYLSTNTQVINSPENEELGWFSYEDIVCLDMVPDHSRMLVTYFNAVGRG